MGEKQTGIVFLSRPLPGSRSVQGSDRLPCFEDSERTHPATPRSSFQQYCCCCYPSVHWRHSSQEQWVADPLPFIALGMPVPKDGAQWKHEETVPSFCMSLRATSGVCRLVKRGLTAAMLEIGCEGHPAWTKYVSVHVSSHWRRRCEHGKVVPHLGSICEDIFHFLERVILSHLFEEMGISTICLTLCSKNAFCADQSLGTGRDSCQHHFGVEILAGTHVAHHEPLERGVVEYCCVFVNETWLEKHFCATEQSGSDSGDT